MQAFVAHGQCVLRSEQYSSLVMLEVVFLLLGFVELVGQGQSIVPGVLIQLSRARRIR